MRVRLHAYVCRVDGLDDEVDTAADPFYDNLDNSNGRVIIFIARGVGMSAATAPLLH